MILKNVILKKARRPDGPFGIGKTDYRLLPQGRTAGGKPFLACAWRGAIQIQVGNQTCNIKDIYNTVAVHIT